MNDSVSVLGIHDGHSASACLLRDGCIVAAVSEERLSRRKNDPGYPRRAVEEVLRIAACRPMDLTAIALGTRFMHHREFFLGWDWYRKGYDDQLRDANGAGDRRRYFAEERLGERRSTIVDHLGVPDARITVVEHHDAHAATAYYACPWVNDAGPVLVLTLDGSGDGVCATVGIGEGGRVRRIAETRSAASIGKVYSRVTFLLGMKPWEDEYKVMGLAPYADETGAGRSYRVIRPLVEVDRGALTFRPGTQLWTNYCYPYLRSQLEGHRFDWIAGAAQRVLEELVLAWVRNAVAHTGIKRVACAGGVFMNVKVNMLMLDLPEVAQLFVFPSCGDESICIGAAYRVYADYIRRTGRAVTMPVFDSVYLGPEFSQAAIRAAIDAEGLAAKYRVRLISNVNEAVAQLLARGEIVARCDGRMEWGARALGNRSILLDPRRLERVRDLNRAIKHRDFWMPFAPTVLAERQREYLLNGKGVAAPYMILAFRTTPEGYDVLRAAIHPYDLTAGPQVLEPDASPGYYDLVKQFEALTGVGAVLNTSFNLHGEPIVCSPQDAIRTFERSGLEFLALGNFLISKRGADEALAR